ncbi:HdeD family acid-resistance protein [Halovulum sp. GXIMD14793]
MKNSTILIFIGLLCFAGGIFALTYPFAAAISTELFLGWAFFLIGTFGLVAVVTLPSDRLPASIMAACMLLIGIFMVANPIAGLTALTVLIAFMFLVTGITRLVFARVMIDTRGYWLLLLSGAVSILLGFMLFADFPRPAENILGVLLGVELILTAVPLVSLGWKLRQS